MHHVSRRCISRWGNASITGIIQLVSICVARMSTGRWSLGGKFSRCVVIQFYQAREPFVRSLFPPPRGSATQRVVYTSMGGALLDTNPCITPYTAARAQCPSLGLGMLFMPESITTWTRSLGHPVVMSDVRGGSQPCLFRLVSWQTESTDRHSFLGQLRTSGSFVLESTG